MYRLLPIAHNVHCTCAGGRPVSPEQHQLLKAVQKIVPEEKVAATVLPLMFKLMYHEHKLAEGVATN